MRGDGWHPTGVSPEDYALTKRQIIEAATAADRNPSKIGWSTRVEVEVHGKPSSDRTASRSTIPGDNPDMMTAGIKSYEEAGVEHIILALNSGDVDTLKRSMETIAAKVIPEFK